ncbi:hypothetical protein [Christiangramia forsetii]|uniref:Uncharacterized protein n=2 Tax=Christiangramia forsetii TaxID=411153 RepID=A0M490_CHRFK|nr:hypothetical protein [Christiangramia forsetii]GGG23974.1 hypothetical protein GCM10011532_03990 [Christiangramia forsetii]CAL67435.1 hypothetical protein GFO_2479 [Christiangramia forsetii KT0803]
MEKLELKHLAPYLPYGLKIKGLTKIYPDPIITGILGSCDRVYWNYHGASGVWKLEDTKLILRPLSDLTKDIKHNNNKFLPIVELSKIEFDDEVDIDFSSDFHENDYLLELEYVPTWFALRFHKKDKNFSRWDDGEGISACKHELLFKLFEWHFDVFGLIEKGLAIDKNKL